jgi:hypothetical protein
LYIDEVVSTSCGNSNGSIDVSISSGTSSFWEWSNGETTEDISGLAAGIYILSYKDNADACLATKNLK